MFVFAAKPNEQVPSADKRGAQGGFVDAAETSRFDEHSGIARVHWQAQHLAAYLSELAISGADRTEHGEQILSAPDRLGVGLVEPVEISRSLNAERVQEQYHLSQISPLNFRRVPF